MSDEKTIGEVIDELMEGKLSAVTQSFAAKEIDERFTAAEWPELEDIEQQEKGA